MKLCATPRAKSRAILLIDIASIQPNPHQPRRAFPESSIAALADSIRRHGLLSPLLVRRIDAGRYELIAGERRLRALKSLGRAQAEAIVLAAYDPDCALLALIENLQRETLHYLDEAEAYRAILANQGMTQDALAATLGVSPSALANRLRLLKLPDAAAEAFRSTAPAHKAGGRKGAVPAPVRHPLPRRAPGALFGFVLVHLKNHLQKSKKGRQLSGRSPARESAPLFNMVFSSAVPRKQKTPACWSSFRSCRPASKNPGKAIENNLKTV